MSGPPDQNRAPVDASVPDTAALLELLLLELLGHPAALLDAGGQVLAAAGWPDAAPGTAAAALSAGAGERLETRPLPGGLSVLLRLPAPVPMLAPVPVLAWVPAAPAVAGRAELPDGPVPAGLLPAGSLPVGLLPVGLPGVLADTLERSEARYRTLTDATLQYVWTTGPDGRMGGEQPGWALLTGQRPEQFRGFGWSDAIHPDDLEATLAAWSVAVATGARYDIVHRVRHASGTYRHFRGTGVPLLGGGGEVREWVGLHTDISVQKAAEAQLQLLNGELQQLADQRRAALTDLTRFNTLLLEAAGEGIFGLDAQGRALFVNPVAARLLGSPASALLGRDLHEVLHARRADGSPYPAEASPIRHTLQDGRTRRVVGEVFWTAQGRALPVEYVCTALMDEQGRVQGVVAVFQDVTQRLEAEEHLKATVAQLERSNLELERSNRDLEQFAYIASHDLQEPLRTLGSYADLLGRRYAGSLDERGRRYLSFLTSGAERMRQLVQDLLSFSRIGQGSVARAGPQDLGTALARVSELLAAPLRESGARLECGPLLPVWINALQLEQLLGNVLSNAVKFARPGVLPLVTVSARMESTQPDSAQPESTRTADAPSADIQRRGAEESRAGDGQPDREPDAAEGAPDEQPGGPPMVHVTVQDNGIGVEEPYQERVFSLFQRLHRREDYEGTGLGLAICRRIVERAGGRIWLTSRPGEGTTVHFTLPSVPIAGVPVTGVPGTGVPAD